MVCPFVCFQVYGYAMFKAGKRAVVRYPMEGYSEDVAGRSFHHGESMRVFFCLALHADLIL